VAAAGGSSLLVFALIARAAWPGLDSREAQMLAGAYWPWIGGLHSLLDNLVDMEEDRATAQHNLVARYDSTSEAATRMGELARRALEAAWALPGDPRPDVLVFGAMVSFYLSAPAARAPAARPVAEAVLEALGGSARPAMAVFRLRRALAREVDSPAVGREDTPPVRRRTHA
jgi:tetraprenyl-beta-curcumene synthase